MWVFLRGRRAILLNAWQRKEMKRGTIGLSRNSLVWSEFNDAAIRSPVPHRRDF